jgi:GST-like protein
MITLYGSGTPNVQKILFFLGETGLPYRLQRMHMLAGDGRTPEFRAINPNGKVPAIVDHNGPGGRPYTLFESGAILLYLAEKTGRFWPQDMAERYDMIQWLMWQMAGVGPMFGQAIHFWIYAPPEHQAYGRSRYYTELQRLAEVMENRLAAAPYLAGDKFSLADIAVFPWTRRLPDVFGVKPEQHPNLVRWQAAIEARPGWQAVKTICQDLLREDLANTRAAPADQIDRFMGRGPYARA